MLSFLSRDDFSIVISSTPLVSIDMVVCDGAGRYLLGKRRNPPANGFWFVPGGRIYKNETMMQSFYRISNAELGIGLSIGDASLIGVFEHLYPDSIISDKISTHYVAIGYRLSVPVGFIPISYEQHSQYNWFYKSDLLELPDVHPNTKLYFQNN